MASLCHPDLPADPLVLFEAWHAEAAGCEDIRYAGAVHLATVGPDGEPQGRVVLLHEATPEGFTVFTDARSPTGTALLHTPRAALTFYWGSLERQVRLAGPVRRLEAAVADRYFAERPRRSQFTAWVSPQSRAVEDRAVLDERIAALEAEYASREALPRPPYWRAYRVRPGWVEYWQAAARRLHDRFRYTRNGDGWTVARLAP